MADQQHPLPDTLVVGAGLAGIACAAEARGGAVRHEAGPAGIHVPDIAPGHVDTGFAGRAVAGTPPSLPHTGDLAANAHAVAEALATDAESVRTGRDGMSFLERRAR